MACLSMMMTMLRMVGVSPCCNMMILSFVLYDVLLLLSMYDLDHADGVCCCNMSDSTQMQRSM